MKRQTKAADPATGNTARGKVRGPRRKRPPLPAKFSRDMDAAPRSGVTIVLLAPDGREQAEAYWRNTRAVGRRPSDNAVGFVENSFWAYRGSNTRVAFMPIAWREPLSYREWAGDIAAKPERAA